MSFVALHSCRYLLHSSGAILNPELDQSRKPRHNEQACRRHGPAHYSATLGISDNCHDDGQGSSYRRYDIPYPIHKVQNGTFGLRRSLTLYRLPGRRLGAEILGISRQGNELKHDYGRQKRRRKPAMVHPLRELHVFPPRTTVRAAFASENIKWERNSSKRVHANFADC